MAFYYVSFKGLTFRESVNARRDVFYPFVLVTPVYLLPLDLYASLAILGLWCIPFSILFFKWKSDNKPRKYDDYIPPARNPGPPNGVA